MSSSRTAAESKADHIVRMGKELGSIYDALWQEVARIHKKWAEYVALFGTNSTRIELMNEAAPSFFHTVNDALWENMLLHISRLTDPPETLGKGGRLTGKSNLSLRRLVTELAKNPTAPNIDEPVKQAIQRSAFARDWRNRRIAHKDFALALGLPATPLDHASRAAVAQGLAAFSDVLNAVSAHYLDSTTMFELGSASPEASSVLHLLRDGMRYRQERVNRLKTGTHSPQDLKREPL